METEPTLRHTLPVQLTSFIGREDEIAEITALLADPACHLLTLVGLGGIGKTRLALEAARHKSGDFPDGIFFIALQPLQTMAQVVPAVIEALNLQTLRDPRAELIEWLGDKRLLLIMDNFEHVMGSTDIISDILAAAPGVKILVTSRNILRLQEEWVRKVGGLLYPDDAASRMSSRYSAVQLFVERARQKRGDLHPENDYEAIVRICQLVGGMPLALELAAGWVEAFSFAEIAAELEYNSLLLTARTNNISPRHQSILAVFDRTWQLLSEQEQAVMHRFAVFRGGCTRDAAEQITGADLPLLAELVAKSLLRHDADTGRYDIHELVRQYVGEQLQAHGETQTARDAHSDYYANFLHEQWGPLRTAQQVAALDTIEAELENIYAAWQTMVEQRHAARLSLSVYPLWYYCDLRGRYHNALLLFEQAEDALRPAAGDEVTDRAIGQMLTRRAFFHGATRQLQEGRALGEEGLAILRRAGTAEDLVLGLESLCLLGAKLDDLPLLEGYAEQMEKTARLSADRWLLARALIWYHPPDADPHDSERARQLAREAVDLAEACGDLWVRGSTCKALCYDARLAEDYTQAFHWGERALRLCEELGQVVTIVHAHHALGDILLHMDDCPGALSHYLQALRLVSRHEGYIGEQVEILASVAELWILQGNHAQAVELITLILQRPEASIIRDTLAKHLRELQSQMPPDSFLAAQHAGRQLELKQLIQQLLRASIAATDDPALQANQSLPNPLTPREHEVLRLLADGLSNQDIARQLVITRGTVRGHLNKLYHKLDARNRVQAIAQARKWRLL